jgi:preprotein translocase subunit SecD
MTLNAGGQKLLHSLSAANIGHPVAIVLDGEALSLPIVVSQISGNSLVISPYGNAGDFSSQAQDMLLLRAIINHGPLNSRWKVVHMARLPSIRQPN